jgi:dTDP-4-amino-4,6-dideoxygalactose transaminase
MDAIHRISERFQLEVIEDAAQAIGAECPFDGATGRAGAMGEVGYFSFYPSKNLGAAGDAGMVICRDDALAQRLRVCRQHGMEPRYYHHFIGGNFRLDEMQAAILAVKLPFLDAWSAARRGVADFYREEFKRLGLTSQLSLPAEPHRDRSLTNHHIYHQYVIRTPQRDALREHLMRKEIGTAIYYPLGLHEQTCFAYLGYRAGDFPETERAARETLALPMYPELSRDAQRYVVEAIAEFLSPRKGVFSANRTDSSRGEQTARLLPRPSFPKPARRGGLHLGTRTRRSRTSLSLRSLHGLNTIARCRFTSRAADSRWGLSHWKR